MKIYCYKEKNSNLHSHQPSSKLILFHGNSKPTDTAQAIE